MKKDCTPERRAKGKRGVEIMEITGVTRSFCGTKNSVYYMIEKGNDANFQVSCQ